MTKKTSKTTADEPVAAQPVVEKRKREEDEEPTKTEGETTEKLSKKALKRLKKANLVHDIANHPALEYLDSWNADKKARKSDPAAESTWKFNKARQTYLLHHAFDEQRVRDVSSLILSQCV